MAVVKPAVKPFRLLRKKEERMMIIAKEAKKIIRPQFVHLEFRFVATKRRLFFFQILHNPFKI